MKKAVMKFTACVLAVGMASANGTVVLADSMMAGLGLADLPTAERSTEEIQGTEVSTESAGETASTAGFSADAAVSDTDSSAETSASDTDSSAEASASDTDSSAEGQDTDSQTTDSQSETEAVLDTSMSGELAFAQCEEYINVRSTASTDGEVVGKVYNNGSVTILGQIGDWYQIQSGNATGYVKAEYFATGEEAEAIADEVGYNVATVYPEALVVRAEASEDSEQIAIAYESDQLEVVEYEGDWMKVALGNDVYGYVNAYYVSYDTYYGTAETLEEEQERLDEQWLAYLAEQKAEEEAAAAAAAAAAEAASYSSETTGSDSSYSGTTYDDSSYSGAAYDDSSAYADTSNLDAAQAAAEAAYQEYLDAQAVADAATQGTDEQAVYDTAAAAQAAYQEYLSEQAVVDELAAGQTVSTETQQEGSYTDTSYTDTSYTDTSYTDTSSAQAAADAAYQEYLDAQAVADAATQGTDEQAVYDTAAAAQAAYQEYLNEQSVADQAAAGQTVSTETQQDTTYQETTYQETYTEETQATESASTYSSTGQSIADYAVQFVGNPYVWGGTSLTNGADCSGFTQSVFANFGISIPRTAAEQASGGTAVDLSSIQAGDLLFYSDGSGISHVALYIGGGQVVHASTSSTGIIISSYNYRTPVCARRYY